MIEQTIENKIAAPGTDLYYSLLYTTDEKRQAIQYLFEFSQTINNIRYDCSELHIAQQKLAWWKEELTRVDNNCAIHPLAKNLVLVIKQFALPSCLFDSIITAAENNLAQEVNCLDDYVAELERQPDIIKIISQYILTKEETVADFATAISIAVKMMDNLLTLRKAAVKGIINLPLQELSKYAVSKEDIFSLHYSDALASLFADYINYCQQYYDQALKQLAPHLYLQQLPLIIYARLKLALLTELKTTGADFFKCQVRLTPLSKLWIAWKTKRWAKKKYSSFFYKNIAS